MRYELDGTKVSIFNDTDLVAFWIQETYPNGDEFSDSQEAENWAIAALDSLDPSSLYECPIGKDIPRAKKKTSEELAAILAKR